jgi:topoisomerase-4 subunit A
VKVILKEPKDTLLLQHKSKGKPRLLEFNVNFADIDIKGKESLGNLVTKYDVDDVRFVESVGSTLGGREVWFDRDVLRLNYDGRGESLGVFQGNNLVLVVNKNGEYYTTDYSDTNHYEEGILLIEKFNPDKVWTVALYDPEQKFSYLKRFKFEASPRKQRFLNSETSSILAITDNPQPKLEITFGGEAKDRLPLEIDAEEFIGVKSFKAKGKRLSIFEVATVVEMNPVDKSAVEEVVDEPQPEDVETVEEEQPESVPQPQALDRSLFDEENIDDKDEN